MNTRSATIAALAIAGLVAGPLLLPPGQGALPWLTCVGLIVAGTIGVPMLLGAIGSPDNPKTVARVWTALGALAIVLVAAGTAAAAVALGAGSVGPQPLLALSAGVGLLAGLGLVKLALRQARTRNSP